MLEFKINSFIKLKLEDGKTNIYVNNELFNQCKYALVRKKVCDIEDILEIESVDELIYDSMDNISKNLDHSIELKETNIIDLSPKIRFWVHCSNMQVWEENNYDTRLLHKNLAFPLLKKLAATGDPIASKVFKEEIAKRFNSGFEIVEKYLIEEKMLNHLNESELWAILPPEATTIKRLKNELDYELIIGTPNSNALFETKQKKNQLGIGIENKKIVVISLYKFNLSEELWQKVFNMFSDVKTLKNVYIKRSNIKKIPISIENLDNLNIIDLSNNKIIHVPENIGKLRRLKKLYLNNNNIKRLPKSLEKLEALEMLNLGKNNIKKLPDTLGKLKRLKVLKVYENKLKKVPEWIRELKNLESLHIDDNNISNVPEFLNGLDSLKFIFLRGNKISKRQKMKKINI